MSEQRKLAAILAADVVGFSRLTGADEDLTLARLRALRSDLIDPTIAVHKGRVVKRTGDGAIVEFRSVVDAVRCAIEVQNAMVERNAGVPPERQIIFRVGIHLGDVVEESDGDLMGDGVNIAARLEGVAAPGAICLSEDAYRQVKSRLDITVNNLGETHLKNIRDPIRVYSLQVGTATAVAKPAWPLAPALPDKPSIAVLPFQNMSRDAEQEYFADGIVEDIITALSRFSALFVIARNSTFTYKGRAVDVKQVGRELGVRYVLEGSVRKSGDRMRITGQLIDAATGAHLWADRIEGMLENVFDLQDRVTASVVGAIAPKLEQVEIERARLKPTDSLDAYDYYLRGVAALHRWTRQGNEEAIASFTRAVELDPNYAAAYGQATRCYVQRKAAGWDSDRIHDIAETQRLARHAAKLGKGDAVALCTAGFGLVYVVGDLDDGIALNEQALTLNPNLAWAWMLSGWSKVWQGEPETAIEHAGRAMRLSPQDSQMFAMRSAVSAAHFCKGRPDVALSWAESAMRDQPDFPIAVCIGAASAALLGKSAEAGRLLARLRQLKSSLRVGNISELLPFRRPEDAAKVADGLRRAGLPE